MGSFIAETSNYILILTMGLFLISNFCVFFFKNPEMHRHFYSLQILLMILFHSVGYLTLFMRTEDIRFFFFFAFQEIIIFAIMMLFHTLYKGINRLLLNNTVMFLFVGYVILGRLSYTNAVRQFCISIIALVVALMIPFLMSKFPIWKRMEWVFCGLGISLLGAVWLTGTVTNGSKLAFKILSWSFQPSEFVKISFILFIATILKKGKDTYRILSVILFSLIHVSILVLSRDLGGAAIYCVILVLMLYVACEKFYILLSGGIIGVVGAILAYKEFNHVRVRVQTWLDPWSDLDNAGYQLTQSLFAIGTGGWFGMGLTQGTPQSIPYVNEDFVFSAIAEEFGVIFSAILIMLYLATALWLFILAQRSKKLLNRLIYLGIGVELAFQVLLTVGGGTRFIPLTGVTLPLISMGGSSLMATILMFTVAQGLYLKEFGQKFYPENDAYEEDFEEVSEEYIEEDSEEDSEEGIEEILEEDSEEGMEEILEDIDNCDENIEEIRSSDAVSEDTEDFEENIDVFEEDIENGFEDDLEDTEENFEERK